MVLHFEPGDWDDIKINISKSTDNNEIMGYAIIDDITMDDSGNINDNLNVSYKLIDVKEHIDVKEFERVLQDLIVYMLCEEDC